MPSYEILNSECPPSIQCNRNGAAAAPICCFSIDIDNGRSFLGRVDVYSVGESPSDIVKDPNKADKKMNPRRKIPLETFLIRDDRRDRDHFGCQTITIFRGLIVLASKLMGILLMMLDIELLGNVTKDG